jgi:hypothetical protein
MLNHIVGHYQMTEKLDEDGMWRYQQWMDAKLEPAERISDETSPFSRTPFMLRRAQHERLLRQVFLLFAHL